MIGGVGDQDRNAILARRALFISAALAGIGCTTHSSPNEPEPTESVEPPKVVLELPSGATKRPTDGERPSWAEILAGAPPLDVPEGLTASERALLTNLAENQRGSYEALGKIWSALPECSPSAADCQDWTEAIEIIRNTAYDNWGPLCGYIPEMTYTYLQRERAHQRYRQRIADMLLADLDAAVDARTNPADIEAWRTQRAQLLDEAPRPCLSCVAPTAVPITEAILFATGDATLSGADPVLLMSVFATQQRNRHHKAKLIVRGHASPSETDPESLARQRAQAVADALIASGADARHIEVRSYADALPISNDPAEAELNSRVDFEVVMP
jgi:outer membrane protein OmpA-like peptidoglycan-associated protein